jgi:hypothetical protein
MSGSRKEELAVETAAAEEAEGGRELYLRDGRKLVVSEQGGESLVEVRSESGMLEVRIRLTEQGPVLQMESARLSLKATEAVEIESERVEIKGGAVKVHAEEDLELDADRDVRVAGKMIYLN